MAAIIDRVGPCEWTVRKPTFETLVRSITFQQLHGKAAATIFARLKVAVGSPVTATAVLRVPEEQLRACGLSRQKTASIVDLAEHVVRRKIQFSRLGELPDEEIIARLCQVRGVGVWTVQMFLMFALQRPNILPVGDFGIRNAARQAYGLSDMPKPAELVELARKWEPYCTTACWYLWRSLDTPVGI